MIPTAPSVAQEVQALEQELLQKSQRLAELKRSLPRERVEDYVLAGWNGPVTLSSLFAEKQDLIVIHNMGRHCRYCTMWADGFNGLLPHLADRAGFAVVSPDPVPVQQKFALRRGWKFPFYSGRGSTFIKDMGFLPRPGEPWPGVSVFRRRGKKISRIARASFGPFDPFCAAWPLFALLDGGVGAWTPKLRYAK